MNRTAASSHLVALALCLYGCGGGGGGSSPQDAIAAVAPQALDQTLTATEDSERRGVLSTTPLPGGEVSFAITSTPAHGLLTLDSGSGEFSYRPAANYYGTDSFDFTASDSADGSTEATVTLEVQNINDPPTIGGIPDLGNSAYTGSVTVPIMVQDMDGDALAITSAVTNPAIVDVTVDSASHSLTLRPKSAGQTSIQVTVRDAATAASTSFNYTVGDVTRTVTVTSAEPATEAVTLTNPGAQSIDFELTHDGHLAFATMAQIIQAIQALPDEVPSEPLERKIWRFVRDNVYHSPSVADEPWLLASWPTLNSFGWGFCSNVSAVFLQIAEAAGLEARIWELGGHVVPEVRVGTKWQMYDPDLAVYYHKANGTVAGIADLAANPLLVSTPVEPIFAADENVAAYSPAVADIYGSSGDNRLVDYVSPEPVRGSRITLPAGARLIYPGRWTAAPTGFDGATPYTIQQFRQARLDLPVNHAGLLTVPWVLWDVQGTGRVRILGQDFIAGSTQLRDFLARPGQSVNEIEVIENTAGLALIMMINPLWYDMSSENHLALTGRDVWSVEVATEVLSPANRPPPAVPSSMRKPRA